MRKNSLMILESGILLFLSIGAAYSGTDDSPQPVALQADENCDPVAIVCSAGNDDMTLNLHLAGEVRSLKPFTIELSLAGRAATTVNQVIVRFAMVGMDMGENAFKLARQADGTWKGQAMLPVCHHGRKDWRATVETSGERLYTAAFNFQAK
ncbi:MAG: hypothetical protein U1F76_11785 [Candidatus Competibacteraceae bacterium]